ncbi:MAG: hypothetical protein QM484_10220 [Woeseiaceae bacterium]
MSSDNKKNEDHVNNSEEKYDELSNVEVNEKRIEDCIGKSLDQLATGFTQSARRWEMIVYPSLVAFIILAGYGFFLIYSLTKDVHLVVQDMHKITTSMERIVVSTDSISKNMVVMTQTLDGQSASMREMTYHVRGMNMSMNQMRHDMSNVSRPMSFMNDFLPW